MPDTEVIVVAHPSPVFVDSTGRRRRMLRKVAYGFGALCMVYGGLVSVSLAGGPVSSSAVLPLPNLADDNGEEDVVARPSPTPEPVVTTRAANQPILEAFPTRGAPVTRPREARAGTPRSTSTRPSPKPSVKPSSTSAKPVESTVTKKPPASGGSPSPSASPPPPPVPSGGGGGQGGGGTVGPPPGSSPPPVAPAPPVPSGDGDSGGGQGGGRTVADAPAEPKPAAQPAQPEPAAGPADPEPPAEPEPEAADGDAP